jgi:hypothetical protein
MIDIRVFLISAMVMFILPATGLAQSDAERFAEGKAAMNHKDCVAARRAFESESTEARDSAVWLDAVAQAAECVADLRAALGYYEEEAKRIVASSRLTDKIGELRYQARKAQAAAERPQRLQQASHDVAPTLTAVTGAINKLGAGNRATTVGASPCQLIVTAAYTGHAVYITFGTDILNMQIVPDVVGNNNTWVMVFHGGGVSTITGVNLVTGERPTEHVSVLAGFKTTESVQAVIDLMNEANRICRIE